MDWGAFSAAHHETKCALAMKNIVSLLLLSIISCIAHAQFNDSVHYHARVVSTGIVNKTTDRSSYVLNNRINFSVRKKIFEANLAASHVYGKQNQSLSNDDFNSSVDFNLFQTERFYYWGLGTYTKSFSLKIVNRAQAGVGVAYDVLKKSWGEVNLSNGILYESSNLYLADSARETYQTFRNSFRLMYKFTYKKLITLDGTHFIQNSLDIPNDYILRSNNTLSVKLTNWLSLTASLVYNKVNRAATENLLINYGLTVEKYF